MKYHVGQKVRIRKDLVEEKKYGGIRFVSIMGEFKGKTARVADCDIDGDYTLDIDDGAFWWSDEMLEPYEKTLRDVEVGDIIDCGGSGTRKVLGICGEAIHLSCMDNYTEHYSAYTIEEMEDKDWKLKNQDSEVKKKVEELRKKAEELVKQAEELEGEL